MKTHECPNNQMFLDDQKGRYVGWGLIAGPKDIYFDEKENRWYMDNGEYAGLIYFCPWCGVKLEASVESVEKVT